MSDATVDRLEIEVQTQAAKANAELEKMANKLKGVATALQGIGSAGNIQAISRSAESLGRSLQTLSATKTADFTRLTKGIEKLGNVNQTGINNTANALREISNALNGTNVSEGGLKGLSDLANGIAQLGYKRVTNAITNLPLLADAMRNFMKTLSTAPQVSQNLIQMTNAMANLASQGSKYNSTIKSMGNAAKNLGKAHQNAYRSNVNFLASLSKLTVGFYILRRAVRTAWGPVQEAMDFGETINLFQTSFKKIGMEAAQEAGMSWGSEAANAYALSFVDEAQKFNDKITNALSLDPNTIMNYQAVFAQMANAFGLTTSSVQDLSESFTLLGLDIASFFNTGVEEAMVKLRAGLAGETEPLRTLGVDITEATLKMTAMRYGITGTISEMSQAAKTQLRWLAIMDQTETVFGDMAKTIQSPANQMRILQQQWENFTRTLGQIFIPIVTTVLPYINAFVIALQRMASVIAGAMGYELPDYIGSDIYKDITGDIEGIGDAADEANKSVNKLQKSLASFDVLNNQTTSSNASGNLLGGGFPVLDDAIAQKTESYMAKFNDELAKMKNQAEELANKIQPKLEKFVEFIGKISPLLEGIAAAFITYKVVDWISKLSIGLGAINPTAGVAALFVLGIVAVYEAIKKYNEKLVKEDLANRFGEITLSMEEIEEVAKRLTDSKYTANIDIYVTEKQKLTDIEKDIETDLETLNKLNWKVSVGMELTEGEIEQYKATIEKFISDSEAYIEQQHYVTTLAINAVIQDTDFNTEITQLVDEYFNGSKGEMERLGKQLREQIDNALADGKISADEQKVIDNLVKEMAEIQERVADSQFKAKLQMITIEGELTADSFKDLTKKIQEIISERSKQAEEASYTVLASVNAAYTVKMENATTPSERTKIQKDWDGAVKEITGELSKTKATITLDGTEFSLNTLISNYATELDKVVPQFASSTKEVLEPAIADNIENLDTTEAMGILSASMVDNYQTAIANSGMTGAAKKGLQEMLDALEPTKEQLLKIYNDAVSTGNQVPDGVSTALTDMANLGALSGNMDDIAFLIGQKLSTDETFLNLLATSEDAGKMLDDNLIAGLKAGIPDLKEEGDSLVFDVDKAISAASTTSKKNMPTYAQRLIDGYGNTFKRDTTAVDKVGEWLQGINDKISTWKVPQVNVPAPDFTEFNKQIGEYNQVWQLKMPGYADGGIVKGYASGGVPNTGQLFMARENGITEYVGNFGNRTGVANNDQITSAIEEAAYRGYVRAISETRSSNNSGDTVVVIDGKEVFRATQKASKEYYKMTGRSPFPVSRTDV